MNNIKVLFEDDYILVIDKPSGITVNRADTTKEEETVQDFVEGKFVNNKAWLDADPTTDFYNRAGIVHRIDKETSGILLIAKNPEAFANLQAQFKERVVQKTYFALAHGDVEPKEGDIVVPVGRLPWNRKRFGVLAGGREAETKYKVISTYYIALKKQEEPLSLLELNPKTGRTHQIRVHLKYINHPIFADAMYGGRKVSRDDRKFLPRLFLHAAKISLLHPKTGQRIEVESELPKELKNFIANLGH